MEEKELYKNLDLENLEGEEWRDVVGFEGLYAVSNMGRVKSLKDNHNNSREKILSQFLNNNNGYLQLTLCKDGKRKNYLVHRLVGNAFLENKNGYPCFNHKNEIKTDNRAVNLEPCDHKYNLNYKNAQARRVASTDYKELAEKLSRQVYQYSLDGELVGIWQSASECGRNGYNFGAVAACCRNCFNREGNNVYKNYIWSYTPIDSK